MFIREINEGLACCCVLYLYRMMRKRDIEAFCMGCVTDMKGADIRGLEEKDPLALEEKRMMIRHRIKKEGQRGVHSSSI